MVIWDRQWLLDWKLPLVLQFQAISAQGGVLGPWGAKQQRQLRLHAKRKCLELGDRELQHGNVLLVRCAKEGDKWIGHATGVSWYLGCHCGYKFISAYFELPVNYFSEELEMISNSSIDIMTLGRHIKARHFILISHLTYVDIKIIITVLYQVHGRVYWNGLLL